MQRLTKEQAVVITGFTDILCCSFSDFHKDVEQRMGCPIFTHQFAGEEHQEKVKELYREDFMKLIYESTRNAKIIKEQDDLESEIIQDETYTVILSKTPINITLPLSSLYKKIKEDNSKLMRHIDYLNDKIEGLAIMIKGQNK